VSCKNGISRVLMANSFGNTIPIVNYNVAWRANDIKYTSNEIYLDLVEDYRAVLDKYGT
jgi:hypothetical protein